jgi:di/tricarboxylate transporter
MFKSLPPFAIVFLVTLLSVICTQFTANVACATLLLPIAAELVTNYFRNCCC